VELDSHQSLLESLYKNNAGLFDIGDVEAPTFCLRQRIVVQEFHGVLPALMRPSAQATFYCNRFSACRTDFSGTLRKTNFRPRRKTAIGMYVECWVKYRNSEGGEMTREQQITAAWMLLQEVQLDPRSYTARGRQQVRETARISCSLPADVVKRLDSLGNARSHHVEKALKLYLLLMEGKGLSSEPSSTTRKNNSLR